MQESIIFLLLLQVILIGLNAIFAAAEIAVLSTNETKLKQLSDQGNTKARRLLALLGEPAKFLATIQVAITLSGFLGSAFAADNFSEPIVDFAISCGINLPRATLDSIAVVLITLILSYFTLVFGELVPKRIAMKKSESLAMGISGLISGISVIFKPIVHILSLSTNAVLKLFGISPEETETKVSEEEIRMLIDAGSESGAIEHRERDIIQNVFKFNDTTAWDIITHRTEVVFLWLEDDEKTWADTIYKNRHTFFPVCDRTADNVIGILNAKDFFRLSDKSKESILSNAVHPAYFVPESIKADTLFNNMKHKRTHFAVVLDEYGGMVGIITTTDLIEEIVGEISADEFYKTNEPSIKKIDENKWEATGNISISDIEDTIDVKLDIKDTGTLSGLIFKEIGVIPDDGGEKIEICLGDLKIITKKIENRRVAAAIIEKISSNN